MAGKRPRIEQSAYIATLEINFNHFYHSGGWVVTRWQENCLYIVRIAFPAGESKSQQGEASKASEKS